MDYPSGRFLNPCLVIRPQADYCPHRDDDDDDYDYDYDYDYDDYDDYVMMIMMMIMINLGLSNTGRRYTDIDSLECSWGLVCHF